MTFSFWSGNPNCKSIDFRYTAGVCGLSAMYPDSIAEGGEGDLIGLSIIYYENISRSRRKPDLAPFEDIYLLDRLDEEMISAVQGGRSFVFIDYSGEPALVDNEILAEFHEELAQKGLPERQIILSTCNIAFKNGYEAWCAETGRTPIHVVSYDHFLYHFSGTLNINSADQKNRVRAAILARGLADESLARFLCFNNMPRTHRFAVATLLIDKGLDDKGVLSFLQNLEPEYREAIWSDVAAILAPFDVSRASFDALLDRIPIIADRAVDHPRGGLASELGGQGFYAQTRFSLVTESDLGGPELRRITEKIMKPLANGHPFIVMGNYGSLERLHAHGFKSFPFAIDESYDFCEDPLTRVRMVLSAALDLSSCTAAEFNIRFDQIKPILLHNFDRIWNIWKDYPKDAIHNTIAYIINTRPK